MAMAEAEFLIIAATSRSVSLKAFVRTSVPPLNVMAVIGRAFVEKLTASGRLNLPWHRADKKIPCIGNPKPESPNGVKLESFIFDALALAQKTLVLEGDRAEMFAPTKNATGVDSAESCREMLIARDLRRLNRVGITADAGCKVELSPRSVFDDEDAAELVKRLDLKHLGPDTRAVLE